MMMMKPTTVVLHNLQQKHHHVLIRFFYCYLMMMNIMLLNNNNKAVAAATANNINNVKGIQSNFGGVTYASGMSSLTHNNDNNNNGVLYLTGQVGANGCFVGLLSTTNYSWISRWIYPEPAICQSIFVDNNKVNNDNTQSQSQSQSQQSQSQLPPKAYILATTEEGGLYTDTRPSGTDKSTLYGLVTSLELTDNTGMSAQLSEKQHSLLHLNPVQYPRSIVITSNSNSNSNSNNDIVEDDSNPSNSNNDDEYLFVLSMDSENSNEYYGGGGGTTGTDSSQIPNLTPGGIRKFGNAYTMTISKLNKTNFHLLWQKEYGLHTSSHGDRTPNIDINQMLMINQNENLLVVIGSTRGSGPAFGYSNNEDYYHGFITKIDPNNGRQWVSSNSEEEDVVVDDATNTNTNTTSTTTAKSLRRFSLGKGSDDDGEDVENDNNHEKTTNTYFKGMCTTTTTTTNDIYIVGYYTSGDDQQPWNENSSNSNSNNIAIPFIMKLDSSTLNTQWITYLDGTSANAYGLSCGISDIGDDGNGSDNSSSGAIYMAGIIESGEDGNGIIDPSTVGYGGDDIFVMKFNIDDGSKIWSKQIGTTGNERLAYGSGSGLLVMTKNDDHDYDKVIIYGDTTGNMYDQSEHEHELFLVELDGSDGSMTDTMEVISTNTNSGGADNIKIHTPQRMDLPNPMNPPPLPPDDVPPPSNNDGNNHMDDPSDTNEDNDDPSSSLQKLSKKGNGSRGIFVVGLLLIGIFVIGYLLQRHKKDKEGTERALVFSYLQHFDVEDIDVRHSATGGWHGTYVGKLAQGKQQQQQQQQHDVDGGGMGSGGDGFGSSSTFKSTAAPSSVFSASHSSIVKDSLFLDFSIRDHNESSSQTELDNIDVDVKGNERDYDFVEDGGGVVDDVDRYIDGFGDGGDDGLSFADRKSDLNINSGDDPWGKDII